jgi:hypothetical protein
LMRLLMIQADRKRPLTDVFVTEGMLSEEQVAQQMTEFRQSQTNRRTSSNVPAPRGHASAVHGGELTVAN